MNSYLSFRLQFTSGHRKNLGVLAKTKAPFRFSFVYTNKRSKQMANKLIEYINSNYSFEQEYERLLGRQIYGKKMYCPNPMHHNDQTPAAALYRESNNCYCFVCRRSFGVYDLWNFYDKQSIEDLKHKLVLPDTQQETAHRIIKSVKVDRTLPLSKIYEQIMIENGIQIQ